MFSGTTLATCWVLLVATLWALPVRSLTDETPILHLDRADSDQISGNIHNGPSSDSGCSLDFHAEADSKYIRSVVSTKNVETGETIEITALTLPKTSWRVIPGMRDAIVNAAKRTRQILTSAAQLICSNATQLYSQLPDLLLGKTEQLGKSPVRYSTMYHSSIVQAAQRLQNNESNICTTSREHEYGVAMFMCQEDASDDLPEQAVGVLRTVMILTALHACVWVACITGITRSFQAETRLSTRRTARLLR